MKSNNLIEIFGNISDENLTRTQNYLKTRKNRAIFTKVAAVAACLCVVSATLFGYGVLVQSKKDSGSHNTPVIDSTTPTDPDPFANDVTFSFVIYNGSTDFGNEIKEDIEKSFQRLQTDYIDIYLLHRDVLDVPVGPIVEVLNEYHTAGKIGAFGGSN
jgi:hypothetical protein